MKRQPGCRGFVLRTRLSIESSFVEASLSTGFLFAWILIATYRSRYQGKLLRVSAKEGSENIRNQPSKISREPKGSADAESKLGDELISSTKRLAKFRRMEVIRMITFHFLLFNKT